METIKGRKKVKCRCRDDIAKDPRVESFWKDGEGYNILLNDEYIYQYELQSIHCHTLYECYNAMNWDVDNKLDI